MSWRKRTVACPFCHKTFKIKKDAQKVNCEYCAQLIDETYLGRAIKQKKKSSPRFSSFKQKFSPHFGSRKKKTKTIDNDLEFDLDSDNKHKKAKSMKDLFKEAANAKVHRYLEEDEEDIDNDNDDDQTPRPSSARKYNLKPNKSNKSNSSHMKSKSRGLSPIRSRSKKRNKSKVRDSDDEMRMNEMRMNEMKMDEIGMDEIATIVTKEALGQRQRQRSKTRKNRSHSRKRSKRKSKTPQPRNSQYNQYDDNNNNNNNNNNDDDDEELVYELLMENYKDIQVENEYLDDHESDLIEKRLEEEEMINNKNKRRKSKRRRHRSRDKIKKQQYHFYEFMDKKYGTYVEDELFDPIESVLNMNWDKNGYQSMKKLLKAFGKKIPNRFLKNDKNWNMVNGYLIKWFSNQKEMNKYRPLIMKLLIPFCKTYRFDSNSSSKIAEIVITKLWKTDNKNVKELSTKLLISTYYATDLTLRSWIEYLVTINSQTLELWQFLAGINIFAANDKYTISKEKTINDIKLLFKDEWIIRMIKSVFMNLAISDKISDNESEKACAQFLISAKYILPNLKEIDNIYIEIKESKIMKNVLQSKYYQLLISGDNAFDCDKTEIIKKKKKRQCEYCDKYTKKLRDLSTKLDKITDQQEDLKDIVNELRNDNKEFDEEINGLRFEVYGFDKKEILLQEDIKEIDDEINFLKQEIYELEKKEKDKICLIGNNNLDYLNWDKWTTTEILQWIFGLENDKYLKYKDELYTKLLIENIKGDELKLINSDDLLYFGIININDRNSLIEHIKLLINGKELVNNFLSPPPMIDIMRNWAISPDAQKSVNNTFTFHNKQQQQQQQQQVRV